MCKSIAMLRVSACATPWKWGWWGDARVTLETLNSRLERQADRSFLDLAQKRKRDWLELLNSSADRDTQILSPGRLARDLGLHLQDDAIVAWDSGHNTGVLARYVQARPHQRFAGSGMMATMGCAVPYAIAAALAYPGRQVVAFTGDGGLSMLIGELATIVRYKLPIKVVVMKNDTLGQIKWEQLSVPRQSRIRVRPAADRFCEGRGRHGDARLPDRDTGGVLRRSWRWH